METNHIPESDTLLYEEERFDELLGQLRVHCLRELPQQAEINIGEFISALRRMYAIETNMKLQEHGRTEYYRVVNTTLERLCAYTGKKLHSRFQSILKGDQDAAEYFHAMAVSGPREQGQLQYTELLTRPPVLV
jgi:hypothetical protein